MSSSWLTAICNEVLSHDYWSLKYDVVNNVYVLGFITSLTHTNIYIVKNPKEDFQDQFDLKSNNYWRMSKGTYGEDLQTEFLNIDVVRSALIHDELPNLVDYSLTDEFEEGFWLKALKQCSFVGHYSELNWEFILKNHPQRP